MATEPLKAVFDTVVYLQAALNPAGPAFAALELADAGWLLPTIWLFGAGLLTPPSAGPEVSNPDPGGKPAVRQTAERKDRMGPPTLWHQRQLGQDPLSPVLDGRPVQIS
jgi:hypothetical protein